MRPLTTIEQFFDTIFDDILFKFSSIDESFFSYPPINIYLTKEEDALIFELAVAGFDKDEIEVSFDNNTLLIEGNKKDKGEESGRFFVRKLAKRNFQYKFPISFDKYNIDKTKVILSNGILKIKIPIREEKIPKRKMIPIEGGEN